MTSKFYTFRDEIVRKDKEIVKLLDKQRRDDMGDIEDVPFLLLLNSVDRPY